MNPFVASLIRRFALLGLGALGTVLVSKGLLTGDDANQLVELLSGLIVSGAAALLTYLQARKSRQVKLTMGAVDGPISEEAALAKVSAGLAPSVLTPKHEVPVLGTGKG